MKLNVTISVVLLLAVSDVEGNGKILNCNFGNKYEYNLRPGNVAEFGTNNVPPLVFETDAEYVGFENQVIEIQQGVLDLTTLDSIGIYIDLYKAYRKIKGRKNKRNQADFEKFFKQYQVGYTPNSDYASLVISVLDAISRYSHRRDVARSSYLVTASLGMTKKNEWLGGFKYNHVAGVIKVQIGGKPGFLLLDPIFARGPKTVMADGSLPPLNFAAPNDVLQYSMLDSDHIGGKSTSFKAPTIVNAYYVSKSFCSFLQTYTKQTLLEDTKHIYNVLQGSGSNVANKVSIRIFRAENLPKFSIRYGGRDFYLYLNNSQSSSANHSIVDGVCQALNIHPSVLYQYQTDLDELTRDEFFVDRSRYSRNGVHINV